MATPKYASPMHADLFDWRLRKADHVAYQQEKFQNIYVNPKGDRSMHIGVPLDFGDECPPGFLTQVGKTKSEHGEISTVYCVLAKESLQDVERNKFKNFCMFLLNQDRETCPKGMPLEH
ncbi:unnamed protein product [Dibothriocephalus latus]|uniref:Uncharacterized protein n=1 Tax=Dibothriocephalus latus TaxID=60516 RepID=A0A3P7MUW8_DIBLA|nr:unnamed protein product [Dibothriocephalus latus]